MRIDNEISILDFAFAISETVDLVAPELNNHHKRVAYISCNIALVLGIPYDEIEDIVLAAVLHDIGAFSVEERIDLLTLDSYDLAHNEHALYGYELLKGFKPLAKASELIANHHIEYDKQDPVMPIGCHIIHLSDRVSVWIDDKRDINEQIPEIRETVRQNRNMFHPGAIAALGRLCEKEYFLIEAFSSSLSMISLEKIRFTNMIADFETLWGFAKVLSHIIDFRCRFTATHSSGVAAVAKDIADILGFSNRECYMIEIAGFLHDLGKLAVPSSILYKNGPLIAKEKSKVETHAYYTYAILRKIAGMKDIAEWAAYHHEKINGNGYPFHIKKGDFSMFARVMAVADILTAITEDRPYRLGMNREKAMRVLSEMADKGSIDKVVVELIREYYPRINNVRIKSQKAALKEYEAFRKGVPEYSETGYALNTA